MIFWIIFTAMSLRLNNDISKELSLFLNVSNQFCTFWHFFSPNWLGVRPILGSIAHLKVLIKCKSSCPTNPVGPFPLGKIGKNLTLTGEFLAIFSPLRMKCERLPFRTIPTGPFWTENRANQPKNIMVFVSHYVLPFCIFVPKIRKKNNEPISRKTGIGNRPTITVVETKRLRNSNVLKFHFLKSWGMAWQVKQFYILATFFIVSQAWIRCDN